MRERRRIARMGFSRAETSAEQRKGKHEEGRLSTGARDEADELGQTNLRVARGRRGSIMIEPCARRENIWFCSASGCWRVGWWFWLFPRANRRMAGARSAIGWRWRIGHR